MKLSDKRLGWLVLIVVVLVIVFYRSPTKTKVDNQAPLNSSQATPNEEKVLEEVRKKPQVVEAIITEANVLYVSVYDDGTRRYGFANALCELLKQHHSTAVRVKIVKVNSINDTNADNAYGVLLGEAFCR